MDNQILRDLFGACIAADELLAAIERGDITGMSFAFEDDWEDSENGVSYEKTNDIEDGKEVWLRHVKKITGLYDVAIVTHPAYEQTTVGLREASEGIDKAIEEQLKRECGDKNKEDDKRGCGDGKDDQKRDDDPDDKDDIKDDDPDEKDDKREAEEEAAKREAEAKAKEEQEARELEEQEQRFREQQAMRLRHRAMRLRTEQELESLSY